MQNKLSVWLPALQRQVWILAAGRLLSQVGTGFTLFYAPIFFVNQVGLSATAVGIGLGSASVSGVVGRLLGGSFADSRFWGRRRTLLLSAIVAAIASFVLAIAANFATFVVGNLLMGLGIGLYWPATEAAVADLSPPEQRNEAYAITRLADTLGLGVGVVLGGLLISMSGAYRSLFVIDGLSFLVFFAIIYVAIAETHQPGHQPPSFLKGWATALGDRRLLVFCLVNILFTTYIVQTQSTIPLYFTNFLRYGPDEKGFSPAVLSALFTWHIALSVVLQLPVARSLNRFTRPQVLMVSSLFWGLGFILVAVTGLAPLPLLWAILAMAILAIGTITYMPAASSLVVELAPPSLRGVYLSVNSQCWAIGYFIGPPLGGWALDQHHPIADGFWVALALTIGVGLAILRWLNQMEPSGREQT